MAEAVAANPVVDAAPAAAEAPVAADATVQAAEPAKKKGGAGKIIAIVILLLVLIGGGIGAVLFINWHESKDKVVSDAMSKLLNIKLTEDKIENAGNGVGVTKISGKTTVTNKDTKELEEEGYTYVKNTVGTFNAELNDVNAHIKGDLTVNYSDNTSKTMGIETAYLSGGKVYLKLGELSNYGALIDVLMGYKSEDVMALSEDEKTDEIKEFEKKLGAVLPSKIQDQWISVSNDTFKTIIGEENYNDEYSCITSGLEKVSKDSKAKMLEAYEKNSFFEFGDTVDDLDGAKDGLSYYEVKIDENKYKEFTKAVEKIDASEEIVKCFSSMAEEYTKDSSDGKVTQTATTAEKEEKTTTKYYFGVKSWSHEIMNVIVETNSKTSKTVSNYDLSYDEVKVTEPSDAKPIEKVAEEAYDAYIKLIDDNMDVYIESVCGVKGSSAFWSWCAESTKEEFDEMKELSFLEYIKSMFSAYIDDDDYDVVDNCGGLDDEDVNCIDDADDDWDWD